MVKKKKKRQIFTRRVHGREITTEREMEAGSPGKNIRFLKRKWEPG